MMDITVILVNRSMVICQNTIYLTFQAIFHSISGNTAE